MNTDNFCFYLQNTLIQTSQTGGQWYNDTSPFSIPWAYIYGCDDECFVLKTFDNLGVALGEVPGEVDAVLRPMLYNFFKCSTLG